MYNKDFIQRRQNDCKNNFSESVNFKIGSFRIHYEGILKFILAVFLAILDYSPTILL